MRGNCANFRFMKALLFTTLLAASCALADMKAPDFALQSEKSGSNWTVTATAPAAHHFNLQAPISLHSGTSVIKPTQSSEHQIVFQVPALNSDSLRIALYLCDDAKTFCEKHELQYTPGTSQTQAVNATAPTTEVKTTQTKTVHGFILNDPAVAFSRAQQEGKPLIIDFFGIWCPPCNELDEKIFSTREFAKSATRFVRLKLDADSPISWELKSKYHVTGYPTVVFATPQGDEISRVIGFRSKADFLAEMDNAWGSRSTALAKLEELARSGDRAAADRAGIILLNRGQSEEAAKFLVASKAKREFWHLAEIDILDQQDAPTDKQIARIEQAIAEFPHSPNTIDWYAKLSKLYEQQKDQNRRNASLRQAIAVSLELAKQPDKLKGYDATVADLLESEADYREDLEGHEIARADWLAAAHAYEKRGVGPKERANNLEMAYCLGRADETEKARAVYNGLEKVYPDEFTFYFNHARMERESKHLDLALPIATKALEKSYGDNKLRSANS